MEEIDPNYTEKHPTIVMRMNQYKIIFVNAGWLPDKIRKGLLCEDVHQIGSEFYRGDAPKGDGIFWLCNQMLWTYGKVETMTIRAVAFLIFPALSPNDEIYLNHICTFGILEGAGEQRIYAKEFNQVNELFAMAESYNGGLLVSNDRKPRRLSKKDEGYSLSIELWSKIQKDLIEDNRNMYL